MRRAADPATIASMASQTTSTDADDADVGINPQTAYVRGLEEKLEHHKKIIRLYQNLSSLAIHVKQSEQGRGVGSSGGEGDGEGREEVSVRSSVFSEVLQYSLSRPCGAKWCIFFGNRFIVRRKGGSWKSRQVRSCVFDCIFFLMTIYHSCVNLLIYLFYVR